LPTTSIQSSRADIAWLHAGEHTRTGIQTTTQIAPADVSSNIRIQHRSIRCAIHLLHPLFGVPRRWGTRLGIGSPRCTVHECGRCRSQSKLDIATARYRGWCVVGGREHRGRDVTAIGSRREPQIVTAGLVRRESPALGGAVVDRRRHRRQSARIHGYIGQCCTAWTVDEYRIRDRRADVRTVCPSAGESSSMPSPSLWLCMTDFRPHSA